MKTAFEKILTNSHKTEMISYVIKHPESFREAIKLAITNKQPYSWRAAWLLWSCMDKNDKRIRKYVKDIITILPNRKENQQRELLKILEHMEIKKEFEGLLFNNCVTIWEKTNNQPSVRFNAFKILAKITVKHPELFNEIILLTQNQYTESLSATANKSINELIKNITKVKAVN